MKSIEVKDLVPGMVLGSDIFSSSGSLLLSKGSVISEASITTLRTYYIFNVYIEDGSIPEKVSVNSEPSRSVKIKKSPEFKEFKFEYNDTISDITTQLNDIVTRNSGKIDAGDLLTEPLRLMSGRTILEIFDMLHNLRTYDDSTFVHSVNVALISSILARWCGFSEKDINKAMLCGILHDIGKLTVPDTVLRKPAKLTREEYDQVKNHTVAGYTMLKERNADDDVQLAALMHHERCDGSGYPLSFDNNRINKFAKIVAIADVYDAMTSARCYRGPICPFTVIEIMINEGLQKFDTKYIMTFLENMGSTYLNNRVKLDDGNEGEIVFIDEKHPDRPIVRLDDGNILDLMKFDRKVTEIL